jgi:hypothetical protein
VVFGAENIGIQVKYPTLSPVPLTPSPIAQAQQDKDQPADYFDSTYNQNPGFNNFAQNTYSYAFYGRDEYGTTGEGGIIFDPTTGNCICYKNNDEKQRIECQIAECKKANLLVACSCDPATIESIIKSCQHPGMRSDLQVAINAQDDRLVADAVKAHAGNMSLEELIRFAANYPGLDSIVAERLSDLKSINIDPQQGLAMNKREIQNIIAERQMKTAPLTQVRSSDLLAPAFEPGTAKPKINYAA